jgi:hypothetical protein
MSFYNYVTGWKAGELGITREFHLLHSIQTGSGTHSSSECQGVKQPLHEPDHAKVKYV